MSGETKQEISGWSTDTLKEHLTSLISAADTRYEQRFLAQEKVFRDALLAAEKAVAVAERNSEEWRKGANEWRGSMTDRERNFVARAEFDALKERVDKTEGIGKGMRDLWGWGIAAAGVLIAAVTVFFKGKP